MEYWILERRGDGVLNTRAKGRWSIGYWSEGVMYCWVLERRDNGVLGVGAMG